MPLKILFFTGGSYVAGLEIISLSLIKNLKERGYDVRCVVNGWNDGDFKNRLTKINVPFYEVKLGWLYLKKPIWTYGTLVNYPKAYFTCKKVLNEFNPDIVNFTGYAMPIMLYPLVKKNSFYTLHDMQLPNFKHRLIYRLLNRKINTFIAVSNHIAVTLKNLQIPGNKTIVIHNGVSSALPQHARIQLSKNLTFAIIGQVAEWKGHEVLIDAVEMLVAKGRDNFLVYIIGNNQNSYSQKLLSLIKEKKLIKYFVWRGFIQHSEEIYKDVDVVVVPSMTTANKYFVEAFSLSTAEAMIRGLVAIASDNGGMQELIEPAISGLLFKEGDSIKLSECMETVFDDKTYLEFLGKNAQVRAQKNFSTEVMCEKYIALCHQQVLLFN